MRIGIVGLLHESNTFVAKPTTLDDFERATLLVGKDVELRFAGSHHELGGFFSGLASNGSHVEAVPLLVARALPSGTIAAECWQKLLEMLFGELDAAGPLDGLLVAPHGATVSENEPDADGHWLTELRSRVGSEVPLIGTLDSHANLSPRMVAACDALIAYRTNPHLDQRQRGEDAARLLQRTIEGDVRPCMRAAYPAMAINIERQATEESPLKQLHRWLDRQLQRRDVLSNSLLLGFPYADVAELGCSTIAVTDNEPELAAVLADEMGERIWDCRDQLVGRLISVEEALNQAESLAGPICLLDMGDNIGGGSAGDGTFLLHGLHARELTRSLVCLFDPEAVQNADAAGVGCRLELSVGGKTDLQHGPPLTAPFVVRSLHDGRFQESEVRHGGFQYFDQGRTAIVESESGLTVMLTSRRMVPFSLEQIRSCGLDPLAFRILVAKGVNAPIAAYREVCGHFIRVNTGGATSADLEGLGYRHRARPMFPWEAPITPWRSSVKSP